MISTKVKKMVEGMPSSIGANAIVLIAEELEETQDLLKKLIKKHEEEIIRISSL